MIIFRGVPHAQPPVDLLRFALPKPPVPWKGVLRAAVRRVLEKGAVTVPKALVDSCLAAYRTEDDGMPRDPLSLWTEVWGDGLFRYQIVPLAERHARRGTSPQYVMVFAHPVRVPHFGIPHEATSKFLFGTYGLSGNAPVFGDGPLEQTISGAFIDLVVSFPHTGVPISASTPKWPVFSPDRPSTLVPGGDQVAKIATTGKARQLQFWDRADWVPVP